MPMTSPVERISGPRMVSTPGNLLKDRKSTRLNSSHANIYTLSLHDALPILRLVVRLAEGRRDAHDLARRAHLGPEDGVDPRELVERSEEHTSELQSRQYLHSFPTRRSSDLAPCSTPRRRSARCP